MPLQALEHLGEHGAGDQDLGLVHGEVAGTDC